MSSSSRHTSRRSVSSDGTRRGSVERKYRKDSRVLPNQGAAAAAVKSESSDLGNSLSCVSIFIYIGTDKRGTVKAETMEVTETTEIIDLCSPVTRTAAAAPPPPPPPKQSSSYVPRTLAETNRRYSILPSFPASIENDRPDLLLVNVPGKSCLCHKQIGNVINV